MATPTLIQSGARWSELWGARAPSHAGFGALAETGLVAVVRQLEKVHDGEGAIVSTRGACAPQQ